MAHEFTTSYLADSLSIFHMYKRLADKAMAQLTDDQLYLQLDPESNSIAVIVKHMAGNMRSRWTDLLTTDGEKPDRDRDSEFELPPSTRTELLALWDSGWKILFDALEPLTEEQMAASIMIRSEPHSVMQAINRQVAHYSMHVGQIVFLAKHLKSAEWITLTVPRGKSREFTQMVQAGEKSQR